MFYPVKCFFLLVLSGLDIATTLKTDSWSASVRFDRKLLDF